MRVLLLSAYHAASHADWCNGLLKAFPDIQWTLLSLPGRYFSWRIRGNSLSWAWQQRDLLQKDYDLLLATSMVDLSSLRGFVPKLAQLPTIVYFHENQFSYPLSERAFNSVEPQIINLYTALCADHILFNSDYNRSSFKLGVEQLLSRLPDQVPAGLLSHIDSRSQVLPVPLDDSWFSDGVDVDGDSATVRRSRLADRVAAVKPSTRSDITLLWSGRHEYDKGPNRLLAILQQLEARKIAYKLVILGQQFKNSPAEFATIRREFAHRLLHFGYLESKQAYAQWLCNADLVLSTAIHEFQGLAAMEAAASGCVPILPDRLAYPEWAPAACLYKSYQTDIDAEAVSAVELIASASSLPAPDLSCYSWAAMQDQYGAVFRRVANR